ncbi:MAG: transposase [Sulfurimonas sp.]|uniref:transposase n=1 Tax=Sulfurimonas sp. TaxID=2022749 RepID=UPI0025F07E30|nr:transposase [Sulfurimonas sp.]MCK9491639.1 transposase [Sulfurimonas sp.]
MEQKLCFYCNNRLYQLKNRVVKCSSCAKKYSLLKLQRDLNVVDTFVESATARACAIKLDLSYQVVFNRYEYMRKLLIRHSHDYYEYKRERFDEFEEYMYICKSKKKDYSSIIQSQNFITFAYEEKVYTFLLPSLKRFGTKVEDAESKVAHKNEFKKFMLTNRISKLKTNESTITKFWRFFEIFITPYKGVKSEYFLSYLKEAEFKFNYTKKEQRGILRDLWRSRSTM